MVRSATERAFDVVIVDATGKPADCSLRLRAELLLRYTARRLDRVARPGDDPVTVNRAVGDVMALAAYSTGGRNSGPVLLALVRPSRRRRACPLSSR